MSAATFTIRVYGLLLHEGRLLVADELIKGHRITKFPGGGLEYGEGLKDALVREVREEIGVEAMDVEHFYTTDFFQQSAFYTTPMQVVSVYYTFRVPDPAAIPVVSEPFEGLYGGHDQERFRWIVLDGATEGHMTLPIDRVVLGMVLERLR
jgi:ADP-ribose pyrophosphatase YjhB (NUDIX family)